MSPSTHQRYLPMNTNNIAVVTRIWTGESHTCEVCDSKGFVYQVEGCEGYIEACSLHRQELADNLKGDTK